MEIGFTTLPPAVAAALVEMKRLIREARNDHVYTLVIHLSGVCYRPLVVFLEDDRLELAICLQTFSGGVDQVADAATKVLLERSSH